MNKTKRKILDTALILLNEKGIAQISQRSISDYLKISPGNLTYHYKKKADIIESIYFELVEEMNTSFELLDKQKGDLQSLIIITETLFKVLYKFRFFFIDIVYILRNYPIIATHYRKLQENRKIQFKEMVVKLLEQKLIRPEELPNEYNELYNRVQITFDFYLSFIGVNTITPKDNYIEEQKQAFIYAIYPYLTKKGKELFSTTI